MMTDERRAMGEGGHKFEDGTTARQGFLYRLWKMGPAVVLVFLIGVALVLSASVDREKERLAAEKAAEIKTASAPANVVVQKLVPMIVEDRLSLPATVEPWTDLELRAQIQGRVVEIPVRIGKRIDKGAVVARVDSRDYELALTSARAAFELARAERTRIKDLFERGLVSKSDLDRTLSTFDSSEAVLGNAKLQLERCTITSPISGMVNRLDVEIGTLLKDGDPVAEIHELNRVKVVVGIPEADVSAVRRLDKVEVVIPALENRVVTGRKYALTSDLQSLARLYRLELEVVNPDGDILPSMFGRAGIVKAKEPESLAVPLYAVISRNDANFVYIVNDMHAVRREVELGILDGWKIQVKSGLNTGDRVIVVGHRNVNEGQEVAVVREVTDPSEILR